MVHWLMTLLIGSYTVQHLTMHLQMARRANLFRRFMSSATSGHGLQLRIRFHEYFHFIVNRYSPCSYRCLGHVVNLGNVAFIDHITKIAAVENVNMIWEFDPSFPNNRVLGSALDVIVAVWTLSIKVCHLSSDMHWFLLAYNFIFSFRSSHLPSVWSASSTSKKNVTSRCPWRSPYPWMSTGVPPTKCLTECWGTSSSNQWYPTDNVSSCWIFSSLQLTSGSVLSPPSTRMDEFWSIFHGLHFRWMRRIGSMFVMCATS